MYIVGINMYYTILHNTYHTRTHITTVVCGRRSSAARVTVMVDASPLLLLPTARPSVRWRWGDVIVAAADFRNSGKMYARRPREIRAPAVNQ